MTVNQNNKDMISLKRSIEMEKKLKIIQLNCNGLYNKLAEVKMYLYSNKPDVLCLCETFVTPKYEPNFIGYNQYWQHREGHKGGLGIFVRRDITSKTRQLTVYQTPQLEHQCIQILSLIHI